MLRLSVETVTGAHRRPGRPQSLSAPANPLQSARVRPRRRTGRTFTVKANETDTVTVLKEKISDLEGAPADAQVLSWNGRTLGYAQSSFLSLSRPEHDDRELSFYGLQSDAIIQLVLNPYVLASLSKDKPNSASQPPLKPLTTLAVAIDVAAAPSTAAASPAPTATPTFQQSMAFQEVRSTPNDAALQGRHSHVASAMVVSQTPKSAGCCLIQ